MKRKQCCALLLAFAMSMASLPTQVLAEPASQAEEAAEAVEAGEGVTLDATELSEAPPRISEVGENENVPHIEAPYQDDELVTAIVELEDAALMDYFGTSPYAAESGEDATVGEAVSDFLASDDAQAASEELLEAQEEVVAEINEIASQPEEGAEAASMEGEVEVIAHWTAAANAMAVKVPYGKLDEIKELKNVKRAYVQHVYDHPDPIENSNVVDGKLNHEYSYEMANVAGAWQEGYTGKGMLVSILDSGLDMFQYIGGSEVGKVQSTHEAFSDDSFLSAKDGEIDWNLRYTDESLEKFLLGNQLVSTTGNNGNVIKYENNALYKNRKVPYGCDYADGDVHIRPSTSDHGTHVAGTVAGCAKTEEGEVKFSGVAPDAQILFMKVFPDVDGGAEEYSIVSALEDSLRLGADVINLSLGSDCGYAIDDTMQNDVFARVEASGIAMMTSAGNSDDSASNSNYNGESLASNPDTSVMSSPAIYASNLSVASIDNAINVESYFVWNDKDGKEHQVSYTDPFSIAMKAMFSDKEYPVYKVGGVGTSADYAKVGFATAWSSGKTGIALVKRGEIAFTEKINNAMNFSGVNSAGQRYGVVGVIIYDNDPNSTELLNMSAEGTSITSAFIGGKDGAEIVAALDAGDEVKIQVSPEDRTVDNATFGQMSSFTSWGPGPGLELKPEITAPGGNIWSTVLDQINASPEGYTGSYSMMSGTSMAAPHMTGVAALVRQYIVSNKDKFNVTQDGMGDLISQLMVSTAIPQKDGDAYYSPRQQGAGLVNAAAAVTTPAYITVDGKNVGKLELLDDPGKTGVYNFGFHVNNITDQELTYKAKVVLMRPDTNTLSLSNTPAGDRTLISDHDVMISTTELEDIVVPAKGTADVNGSVSLNDSQKQELSRLFENGAYVEGYVILTDAAGENPQIGLPLLAFFGDWTAAPIFDSALWFDEAEDGKNVYNNESTWATSVIGSVLPNIGYLDLGQNVFSTSNEPQTVYYKENFTISPNGDGYMDVIDDYVLYQLRNARLVVVEVRDSKTKETYMKDWASYSFKTTWYADGGFALPFTLYGTYPTWNGTDLKGNVLPSGTECEVVITAYGDGDYGEEVYNDTEGRMVTDFDKVMDGEIVPTFNGHAMDMKGDVITFPVVVDTVAPKLENNAVTFVEKNGRTYIMGKVYDEDGSLASLEIVPYVIRSYKEGYGDPDYAEVGLDRLNPFLLQEFYEPATKTFNFIADVTEYERKNQSYEGENRYYDFTWTGDILLSCGDYGVNDRSYAIHVNTDEGLVLSQHSARLHPGSEFELSVNDNTLGDAEITRESSNPEVATVDEYGNVKAIAPGQAIITVSNGTYSGVCVVVVEEYHQIESFDLSLESFTGMKPSGECMVKVTNIQPADAVIQEKSWVVEEDEDYANNYAEGLIQIQKYGSDGLSGLLYLQIDTEPAGIPAGKGTLTVTLDGVSRSMEIGWEDLYQAKDQDDLITAGSIQGEQCHYVTQGQTAQLAAKYRQTNPHSPSDILTELTGLALDGSDFYIPDSTYSAKLVNEEGYALPDSIKMYLVYPWGDTLIEPDRSYGTSYHYDPQTGAIDVTWTPIGATTKLKIVAEGVESPGAAAGTLSGQTYERPDWVYGPFNWEVTEGTGKLETVPFTDNNGTTYEVANYTPAEPGVSYIKATTKDGKYSLNFAVVSEPVKPEAIALDTDKKDLEVGETLTVGAEVTPEPTFPEDKEIVWTSFDESVATVEGGKITAVSEGYAYIKAHLKNDNRVMASVIIHVTPALSSDPSATTRIKLSRQELKLDVNETETLTATVQSADGTARRVTWSSNNPKVATVTATDGKVTGISEGVATITAMTSDGVTANCKVIVSQPEGPTTPSKVEPSSITLDNERLGLSVNDTATLTATVAPANAADRTVAWSSNNTGVAAVTNNGTVTAISKGVATITAQTSNGLTATCRVTVTEAGGSVDPSKKEPASITLDQDTLSLEVNDTETLTATVGPDDAEDKTVTWSTNNADIAAITNNGKVTAISKGVATITAKTSNGLTATCRVTVTEASGSVDPSKDEPTGISLNKDSLTLEVNGSEMLIATVEPASAENKNVVWSSNNTDVAVVAGGNVTALSKGVATITAKTANGITAVCRVTVNEAGSSVDPSKNDPTGISLNKDSLTLEVNGSEMLIATVEPATAENKDVAWSSNNTDVAVVTGGNVTAISKGVATITAKTVNGITAVCHVTVNEAGSSVDPSKNEPTGISLNKDSLTLEVNGSEMLIATVEPATAENKDVTWSSNNTDVAVVTGGNVTAISKGAATITAKTVNGITAVCHVTVKEAGSTVDPSKNEPTGISLNKESLALEVNGTETLTALVVPATAENKEVAWSSNNTGVAVVENSGKVTAIAKGVATITAKTSNGITATCRVTVNAAGSMEDPKEPASIQLNKDAITLEINGTETLTATVAPETAENRSVAWSSNNTDVAVVNAAGKVTAIGAGEATITAKTVNGLTETCKVTVVKGERMEQEELKISGISSLTFSKSATLKVTGGSGSGEITWSIVSGKNYATINAKTGKVLAKGIGTVKVKAVKAGDSQYKEASATFQFKAVLPKVNQSITANAATYRVTSVAKGKEALAYKGAVNKNVTKVVVPETVKIGSRTFKVTVIGINALNGYKKLKSVTIPKNVVSIHRGAFQDCTALTKVTIPANVDSIYENAFKGDKNLKSIVVNSKKVTKVMKNAFKGIHKDAKIKVPASKLKQYQKLFSSKGQPKTVKITK